MDIKAIAKAYAKQHKTNAASLEALLQDVVSSVQATMKPQGRKASGDTLMLRAAMKERLKAYKGQTITSAMLAKHFSTDQASINNALHYIANNEKMVCKAGAQAIPGKRGRPAVVWNVL